MILTVLFCTTGAEIEKLCELQYEDHHEPGTIGADKGSMVRAARCLLAAVTQVLLLADTVVVKQLLLARDKVGTGHSGFVILERA